MTGEQATTARRTAFGGRELAYKSRGDYAATSVVGEYNPSLELALDIAAWFDLPVEAIFSRLPFEPMSAKLYGRPDPTQESTPHA